MVTPSSHGYHVSESESTENDHSNQEDANIFQKNTDKSPGDEPKGDNAPQQLMETSDVSAPRSSLSISTGSNGVFGVSELRDGLIYNHLFQNMLPDAYPSRGIADVVQQVVGHGNFWNHCWTKNSPPDGHCLLHSVQTAVKTQLLPRVELTPCQLLEIIYEEFDQNIEWYRSFVMNSDPGAFYDGYKKFAEFKQYATEFGDLVPIIICNALNICLVLISDDGGLNVQIIDARANRANSTPLFLRKSFEHYDGLVPCSRGNRSSFPPSPTEGDVCEEIVTPLSTGCQVSESVKDDRHTQDISQYSWEEAMKELLEEFKVFMKERKASLPYSLIAGVGVAATSSSSSSYEPGRKESQYEAIRRQLVKFMNDNNSEPSGDISPQQPMETSYVRASTSSSSTSTGTNDVFGVSELRDGIICNQLFQNMLPDAYPSRGVADVVQQVVNHGHFGDHCKIKNSPPDGHCLLHSVQTAFRSQLLPHVELTPCQLLEKIQAEFDQNIEWYSSFVKDRDPNALYDGYKQYAEFKQ